MSTFTIRVTSSAVNAAGNELGQSPDAGAPSFWDVVVTNSSDPLVANGVYDGYCLNPAGVLRFSPTLYNSTENYDSTDPAGHAAIGLSTSTRITPEQIARINWVLAQNFSADSKYFVADPEGDLLPPGPVKSQYNYGEIQTAIWTILEFTATEMALGLNPDLVTDNGRQVVRTEDVQFLVDASLAAVQSGINVLPPDVHFAQILDPGRTALPNEPQPQPVIIQLNKAKLGDFVWSDTDADGIQDAGEVGVNNVVVELYDGAGNLIASTTTGDDFSTAAVEQGYYQFVGLAAGDYRVKFYPPSGTFLTTQDAFANGQDAADSDASAVTGFSQLVTLAAGQSNQTIDAGLIAPSSISGFVYCDDNNDGIKQGTESGIGGVEVRLSGTDDLGNVVNAVFFTNPDGSYSFTGLRPGTYAVTEFVQPAGKLDGKDTAGNTPGSVAGNEVISNIVLGAAQSSVNNNFGELRPVGIDIEKFVQGCFVVPGGDGGEGLTPGFWKTHSEFGPAPLSGWPETGYSPTQSYEAIFGVNVTGAPSLLDALGTNGGGESALLRHSAAALLNAANPNVDYAFTAAEVISMTQAALANPATIEATKDLFATQNELGADLSTPAGGSTVVKTDWFDADLPGQGPVIPVGGTALFKYEVRNTGETELSNVEVTDNRIANLSFTGGDTDNDGKLDTNEVWTYTAQETVVAGPEYVNVGKATGTDAAGRTVQDTDAAHYTIPALTAAIGDRVFEDRNANGVQDAGELGLAMVTVQLKDTAGNVLRTQQTDSNGNYLFDVTPGTYVIGIVKPVGYEVSPKDAGGNDNADSDISTSTLMSDPVVISAGEQNLSVDAGLFRKASIGDKVFLDCDMDGKQDSGEPGVAGVTVHLKNSSGTIVSTTTTNAMGEYSFTGLNPGTYSVQFVKLAGYSFTVRDAAGTTDLNDSDADVASGNTIQTFLESGENDTSWDAGLTAAQQCLTFDFSGNTATDGHDGNTRTYIANGVAVNVNAFSRDKSNGNWETAYVGAYGGGLGVTDRSEGDGGGNAHTIDNVGGRDNFLVFRFNQDVTLDKAFLGFVSGDSDMQVWIGKVDGAFTNGLTLSNSVLSGLGFTEVNTTTSSSARWADLNAGNVQGNVIVIAADTTDLSPEDYFKLEQLLVCTNPCVDPTPKGSIGDKVFLDCDMDGRQDVGEPGVAGVTVNLKDAGGAIIRTTTTDATGNYKFAEVPAGTYSVQFVKPTGYAFTAQDKAGVSDTEDSDANVATGNTANFALAAGQNRTDIDAGLTAAQQCLTFDFSGDTATDGHDGNTRTYIANGVAVNVNAFSRDKSNGTWETAYVGAYGGGLGVTDRSEGDGGSNKHTVDNVGGRDNFLVFRFNQDVTLDKAFLGFVSGDSDMQVWIGKVDGAFTNGLTLSNSVLSGLGFTEVNTTTSSSARWADLNAGNVQGNVIVIAADTTDLSPEDYFKLEQLLVCTNPCVDPTVKGSIGDTVFHDINANGIQETGDHGIAGATVKLLNSAGTVIATTTTDSQGKYLFSGLSAGDYKVQFFKPTGFHSSTRADVGADNADSDIAKTTASSATTATINLSAGENDTTVDAGFYKLACIGDRVWEDKNHNGIQDVGEPGIGGIRVTLLDSANAVVATTTTNSSGNYSFNVDPGTYRLKFDKANVMYNGYNMSWWYWGMKDVGSNDQIDSDVTRTTTTDAGAQVTFTDWTTLTSGEDDKSWDATITPIVIDLNGDGVQTVSRADSGGKFDLFGNGTAVHSGWVSGSDGMLAVDRNGNGVIDDINELFGGTTKGDGFAELAAYDSNGDGKVDAADANFADLLVWQDANGNHVTDAGELMTLEEAGIASVDTGYVELPFVDANGNLHLERSTATRLDGSSAYVTDVYFNVAREDADAAGVDLASLADLLGDDGIDLSGAPSIGADAAGSTLDLAALLSSGALDVAAEASAQLAEAAADAAAVELLGHQQACDAC